MPTGFEGFSKRMSSHGERIIDNANKLKRKAALAVDASVVMATPVDTGRARANWQASLSAPVGAEIEAYAPGTAGSTSGENGRRALEQAKTEIAASQPEQGIFLTNNLPYIGRLNEGHSAQAPSGFVQTAVLIGIEVIRKDAHNLVSGVIRE